jgi:hypothetical protein
VQAGVSITRERISRNLRRWRGGRLCVRRGSVRSARHDRRRTGHRVEAWLNGLSSFAAGPRWCSDRFCKNLPVLRWHEQVIHRSRNIEFFTKRGCFPCPDGRLKWRRPAVSVNRLWACKTPLGFGGMIWFPSSPGCAARPWALEFNAFGVTTTAKGKNQRRARKSETPMVHNRWRLRRVKPRWGWGAMIAVRVHRTQWPNREAVPLHSPGSRSAPWVGSAAA